MQKKVIIIGIAGPSASGKSLLANTIAAEMGSNQVVVITEDSYYKNRSHMTMEERERVNYDHPDAFDHDLMAEHLLALSTMQSVNIPIYDYTIHARNGQRQVGPHKIIVVEGILLLFEARLRELMDIKIFMETPMDICLIRRLRRDIIERQRSLESVLQQYEETVKPMYSKFNEPSKRYADLIIPRGGENRIAIDLIKAKMRELLTT